jgi:hypothetical protein
MTRIGRCQVKPTLYWQCILPARQSRPAQNSQTNCVDQYHCATFARLSLPEWPKEIDIYAITITTPTPQAFFENGIVASDVSWEAYFLTKQL